MCETLPLSFDGSLAHCASLVLPQGSSCLGEGPEQTSVNLKIYLCAAWPCNHPSSERGDRAKLNARLIRNFSSPVSGFSALISEICSLTLGAKKPLIHHNTNSLPQTHTQTRGRLPCFSNCVVGAGLHPKRHDFWCSNTKPASFVEVITQFLHPRFPSRQLSATIRLRTQIKAVNHVAWGTHDMRVCQCT